MAGLAFARIYCNLSSRVVHFVNRAPRVVSLWSGFIQLEMEVVMAEERTLEITEGPGLLEILHCFTSSILDALHNKQMRSLYHIYFTPHRADGWETTKFLVYGIQSLKLVSLPEGEPGIEMDVIAPVGQFNRLVHISYNPQGNVGMITIPASEE